MYLSNQKYLENFSTNNLKKELRLAFLADSSSLMRTKNCVLSSHMRADQEPAKSWGNSEVRSSKTANF